MVKVPDHRQLSVPQSQRPRVQPTQGFDPTPGNAVRAIGSVVLALEERRQRAEDAGFKSNIAANSERQFTEIYNEHKNTVAAGEEFTTSLDEKLQKAQEEVIKQAQEQGGYRPSKDAQQSATLVLSNLRGGFLTKAATYQNNARVEQVVQDSNDYMDTLSVQGYHDPASLNELMVKADQAAEGLKAVIPEAQANALIDQQKRQILVSATEGMIETNAEAALNFLKGNQDNPYLQPEDHIRLTRAAQSQSVNAQALVAADAIRAKGGNLKDRYANADGIEDLEVREATKRQIAQDYQREQNALTETQYQGFEGLAKQIIAGDTPQEAIRSNPQAWNNLTSDQQLKIKSMVGQKTTDLAAYHRINLAMAEGQIEGYQQFMKDADKLAPTEFKHFSNILAKGPDEPDPLFTVNQDFSRYTGEQGLDLNDKEKGKAEMLLREEWNRFQENNPGKKMNAKEQEEMMHRVFDVVAEGGLFSSDIYRFELSPKKRAQLDYKKDIEQFKKAADEYSSITGNMLTKEEADLLYRDMVRSGAIQDWGLNGSNLPVPMVLPDGSLVDEYGNITVPQTPSAFDVPQGYD